MVSVLLIWIYMLLTIVPVGYAVLHLIYSKLYHNSEELQISFFSVLLSGIVVVTLYAEFFSIFYRLGGKASLLLLIANIGCGFLYRKQIGHMFKGVFCRLNHITFFQTFIFFAIVLLVIVYTSSGYFFYDTALYHAQAIHWLESYGVVTGSANIQYRIGYNSSSMCFFALYSFKWLLGQSYHACNGFVLLFTILLAIRNLFNGFSKDKVMSSLCSVATLFCCSILLRNAVSPTSDIMPMALVFWIVMEWTLMIEKGEKDVCPYAVLCVAGVLVFTGKVSMAMIVLVAIKPATILCKEKRIKEIFVYLGMGLFVLLPFLVRNVIITGWVLYPFPGIDLFDFDWKIARIDLIQDAKNSMVDSRKVDVPAIYIHKWLPTWWKEVGRVERAYIIAIAISFLLWMKRLADLCKLKFQSNTQWIHLEFAMFMGIVYWFFTGPVFRYGSSFIVLFPFIIMGSVISSGEYDGIAKWKGMETVALTCTILLCVIGIIPESSAFDYTEKYRFNNICIFKQQDYLTSDVTSIDVGNEVKIYYPLEGDQAWYEAFPASPNKKTAESVEMRGTRIKDGFRKKQYDD